MAEVVYNAILSLLVRDTKGGERSVPLHCEVAFDDPAELQTALTQFVTKFDGPLAGRIVKATLGLNIDISGAGVVKSAPQAGSYVRTGATISLKDTAGNSNPIYLPTMPETKFQGETLMDETEVATLITALLSDNVNGGARITFTDEDDRKFQARAAGGYIRGFRTVRK